MHTIIRHPDSDSFISSEKSKRPLSQLCALQPTIVWKNRKYFIFTFCVKDAICSLIVFFTLYASLSISAQMSQTNAINSKELVGIHIFRVCIYFIVGVISFWIFDAKARENIRIPRLYIWIWSEENSGQFVPIFPSRFIKYLRTTDAICKYTQIVFSD